MGYEYLIAGLPDLSLNSAATMSVEALEALLDETLLDKDKEQLAKLKMHRTQGACAFVRDWIAFNRDLNNVLTAEVCRKHGLKLDSYIIGEMPDEVDPELKAASKMENLYERERRIDAIRFAWLEERTRMVSFSLENVLAYYLMTVMLNRWASLTAEKGEAVFREMVADMKKDVRL